MSLEKKHARRLFLRTHKSICNRHFDRSRPLNPLLLEKLGKEGQEIVALAIKEVPYSLKTYEAYIYKSLKKEWLEMRSEGCI